MIKLLSGTSETVRPLVLVKSYYPSGVDAVPFVCVLRGVKVQSFSQQSHCSPS